MLRSGRSWRNLVRSLWGRPAPRVRANARPPRLEQLESRLSPAAHDTLGTALSLTPSPAASGSTIDLGTAVDGTTEYYRFSTTATGGLHALLTPADGTGFLPQLALYGASGQLLIQANGTVPNCAAAWTQHLQPGTYYLGVSPGANSPAGDRAFELDTQFQPGSPPFQPLPVGSNLAPVATGDFNNDGHLDVVTASANDNAVSISLANGSAPDQPVLLPAVAYSVGKDPEALAVGDFNHDGNLDVVTANYGSNSVSVLLGRGNGTFRPAVSYAVGSGPNAVTVQTVNGNLDVVTSDFGSNTVSVLRGNGDGTFQSATGYAVGRGPSGVAAGQDNGAFYIAAANAADNNVSVIRFGSDGSFQSTSSYGVGVGPHAVVAAYLNGHLEFVTANVTDNTVSVLLGDGSGTFAPAASYLVGKNPRAVAVGNFGGNLGIVTANFADNTLSVLSGNGDGTFGSAVSYAVSNRPDSLALGQFTPGGNFAVVVTSTAGQNPVSVLLGNGDGTFGPAQVVIGETAIPTNATAVGDFLGNGTASVVTVNSDDNTLWVQLNNGDGTFGTPAPYTVGNVPDAVAVGNFSGHLDIVTANYYDNTVSILVGNGDGTFRPAVAYRVQDGSGHGFGPKAVAVGDFNHDGLPDLVTANYEDDTVSVLLGNGDGTFGAATTDTVTDGGGFGLGGDSVAVGDFTHDGFLDSIVTANYVDNTVSVLLSTGTGAFQGAVTYSVVGSSGLGIGPMSVAVGDFTHDGFLDGIVTANNAPAITGDNTVSVLLSNGSGAFSPAVTYSVTDASGAGASPAAVAVGDFNHDGISDIITANDTDNTLSVLAGNADGTFASAFTLPTGIRPTSVAVGDFSQTGYLDGIVTANSNDSLSVLVPQSTLNYAATSFDLAIKIDASATGDFNRDGASDIVSVNYADGTVSLLLGNGDGTFRIAETFAVGSRPDAVAVGDFNHDGKPDLVTVNAGDDSVTVLLGNGDGTFQSSVSYRVGSRPQSVAVGELDGNPVVVTANYEDNTASVLTGNADGTFQPAVSYAVGRGPGSVAVGIFHGSVYIVTANVTDNTVSVLRDQGDGTFATVDTLFVGNGPESVAVGDFTGTGNLGIVTANEADGSVSVLLGNAHDDFQSAATYAVGLQPRSVAVGDFNGRLALVVANSFDNTVSVLFGDGAGGFQAAVGYSVGSGPTSVLVANFNGDDYPDVAVVNQGDSTVSILAGTATGQLVSGAGQSGGKNPNSLATGDLNNDGHPDVVTANGGQGTVTVLLGHGDGTFLPPGSYPVGSGPDSVAVADFNNDGNLDVVTANFFDSSVSVLLGRGDGTFLPANSYALGDAPVGVAVANLGGILSIVTANSGGTVSVLKGNGDGTFLAPASYPLGTVPQSVAVAEYNGQCYIVTANINDSQVSVLVLGSDGTLESSQPFQVGTNPDAVALAVYGGNLFVVAANSADNTVSVLAFASDGTLQTGPLAYPVSNFPDTLAVKALAGGLSIVAGNQDDRSVTALLLRGDGTLESTATYAVGDQPSGVVLGDFNGDGNFDIATANFGDDTLSVLLGQASGRYRASASANGIAVRNVPYLQDLTGDGVADSLVLTSSGDLLVRVGQAGTAKPFAPAVTINLGFPARDATVFQTADGWAVAAVDAAGNSVSLYAWEAGQGAFQRSAGFSTGNLPVRILAADLTGNGRLGDLIVANDFDNSVTIALGGQFDSPITVPVGSAPSDLALLNVPGQVGPDIVISDQVSGDFSVLLNDAASGTLPTFGQQNRFRAGTGLFGIDATADSQTVLSQLQTLGIVAGPFTGSAGDDLIVVNRGSTSFTLLPSRGPGIFAAPQSSNTYATSARPTQIISLTLPGDARPSVAILMADLSQVWVYRNNGDGTFAFPVASDAGNDASGFSVATVRGQFALQVGNGFGDVLTLLYEGGGHFAPDRTTLQHSALAVGTLVATHRQFAVVADQARDQVTLYYRTPGTTRFGTPIPLSATTQLPLLAPGAVQTFSVPGDPSPYLAVANSLSNNVLVYRFNRATEGFDLVHSYQVGDDPVSITVADLNGDLVPDLLVANEGSNDVSVLIGSVTGTWTATPYQRLASGGSGPLAVTVRSTGGGSGPDLLVTNGSGKVTLLPGIGSGGVGSGLFQDNRPQTFDLGTTIVQSLLNPATGQFFVVGGNGTLSVLTGTGFASLPVHGVVTLATFANGLVAGFDDGTIDLLSNTGFVLATSLPTGFTDQLSALEVLENGNSGVVVATQQGSDVPIIVSFAFIPIVTEPLTSAALAQGSSLPGADLVLVATLISGDLIDRLSAEASESSPGDKVFALLLAPRSGQANLSPGVGGHEATEVMVVAAVEGGTAPGVASDVPAWERLPLGVDEALRQRLERQQAQDGAEDFSDALFEGLTEYTRSGEAPTSFLLTPVPDEPVVSRDRAPEATLDDRWAMLSACLTPWLTPSPRSSSGEARRRRTAAGPIA